MSEVALPSINKDETVTSNKEMSEMGNREQIYLSLDHYAEVGHNDSHKSSHLHLIHVEDLQKFGKAHVHELLCMVTTVPGCPSSLTSPRNHDYCRKHALVAGPR